ncbi:hypothetical protein HYH03_001046 [Edaphochlamys debaryana]|uniref:Uncharacterized protein n=1 Tax=Edaphochlamys debaryana TaxID=47281 RepID=A0A835YGC7_9CHLO|nr:hypothetical protein HYH03_001046 [Edaphochlamys debaryana]|eukprot:KAG2501239.1 hypothetical protein HYH03_001046 [Edaphochlamys debaryana]
MLRSQTVPPLSDDILAKFAPVLYLHPEDQHRPCSVEWFIERSILHYYPGGVKGTADLDELAQSEYTVRKLREKGHVTQEELLVVQSEVEHPDNLSITVSPEHYGGCEEDALSDVPIYVHAKLVVDERTGTPEAYEINYITFYSFNGFYHLPAGLPLFKTGHHVGDWEHMTVRLHANSLELQGVWYNAHRNIEGEWCPAAQVPRSPCGRLLGFVAINGHGIYPTAGTIPRLFLIANDRTSAEGPVWAPRRLVRMCGLAHGNACPLVPSRGCSLPCASDCRCRLCLESSRSTTALVPVAPHLQPTGPQGPPSLQPPPPQQAEPRTSAFGAEGAQQGLGNKAGELVGAGSHAARRPLRLEGDELMSAGSGEALLSDEERQPDGDLGGRGGRRRLQKAPLALAASSLLVPLQGLAMGSNGAAGLKAAADVRQGAGSTKDGTGAGSGQPGPAAGAFPLPHVEYDTSPWQRYEGAWGSVEAPARQGWFVNAEPPVSRGLLRRLLLPCAPGVDRLPPRIS